MIGLKEQIHWAGKSLIDYSNAKHTNLTNLHGPQPDHWRHAVDNKDWTTFQKIRWASLGTLSRSLSVLSVYILLLSHVYVSVCMCV